MNRRKFLQSSAATALVLASPAFITGCNSNTIAELVQVLGNSAASIASLQGNTALAQKLKTDTAAAVVAVTNWKSGSPTQMIIEALNLVADDLNLFPQIGPYAPLIDLAIGTVESILALLPAPVAPVAPHATRRTVTLAQPAPKTAKAYKAQFNAIVAGNPALASAEIK
jgi:hypothetical protein